MTTLKLDLPIRTVSELNSRDGWIGRLNRKLRQQREVKVEWLNAYRGRKVTLPCVVTLTRIGPNLLDDDNLAGSFKHIRDEVARLIGIDDGSPQIKFEYKQEAIGKRKYRVIIEVQSL
jgi:hypothetical protein